MAEPRERISNEIKQELRRRTGFGCVICGSPIFDYEHIDGYLVTGHDVDRMTLLCPNHHREKTAGRLPVSVVEAANAAPHNLKEVLGGKHPLLFDAGDFTVEFGNLAVISKADSGNFGSGFAVDGTIVLGVTRTDGRLGLTAQIHDENNHVLFKAVDGEIRFASANWDVEFFGTTIRIRSAFKEVVVEIKLMAPNRVIVTTGNLWFNFIQTLIGRQAEGGGFELPGHNYAFSDFSVEGGLLINIGERQHDTPYSLFELPVPLSGRVVGGRPASYGGGFRRPLAE